MLHEYPHFVREKPMELTGEQRQVRFPSFLVPPESCFWDEDEEEEVRGVKPKSSPVPTRRNSDSLDNFELLPPSSNRKVSFADAFGFSLVSVKEFAGWDIPTPTIVLPVLDFRDKDEYFLSSLFTTTWSAEELAKKVEEQKLELESIEILPGTTTLRGVVRVLNVCYSKTVYIRVSLDQWLSHFDLLAEYAPGCGDGNTECFSFKYTIVPSFSVNGTRVDFCLRCETEVGTFWANNGGQNYVLFCHQKVKEPQEKTCTEEVRSRKSCLKTASYIIYHFLKWTTLFRQGAPRHPRGSFHRNTSRCE
uniref:CBM21 domain-containing protein n=1 Tax=Denticeps clupeoides TaxID=299321 RepID=A0AAY4CKL6_9TELE